MSLKNKHSTIQCTHPKKQGDYCGIHGKSHSIIRIDDYLNNNIIVNPIVNPNVSPISTLSSISSNNSLLDQEIHENLNDNLDIKMIDAQDSTSDYPTETLNEMLNKKMKIMENSKIKDVRAFIRQNNFNINTKSSKNTLIKNLRNYSSNHTLYLNKLDYILKIQQKYKNYLHLRRKKCINETDVLTLESKYNISEKYYIELKYSSNIHYCFDIRSLNEIIANEEIPKNPYTGVAFTAYMLELIKTRLMKFNKDSLELKKPILSEEQKIRQQMIDVFQKFDSLDNYTDYRWFQKLTIIDLRNLWRKAEDIWNYRCEITHTLKKNILNNTNAFVIPVKIIDTISNKGKLHNLILSEFDRFLSDGKTREDKKIGAMLMLTALVEVSPDAADAMPHYIQVS